MAIPTEVQSQRSGVVLENWAVIGSEELMMKLAVFWELLIAPCHLSNR